MPKMIKIGEIRVLNYFDLPWNEPIQRCASARRTRCRVDARARKETAPVL